MSALQRWRKELGGWRIDDEILRAAPESPYLLPAALFRADARDRSALPTTQLAREVLPFGGSVLDVGCGGGAAGLALVPPAGRVVGIDRRMAMLTEFRAAAERLGVDARAILGTWPDAAVLVEPVDVAVCAHVVYDVPDLAEFAKVLAAKARRRVVIELTAVHPWVPLGGLWRAVHGQHRPAGPTCELALEVLAEAGIDARVRRWTRQPRRTPQSFQDQVAMTRRRLCLPMERDPEVEAMLGSQPNLSVEDIATIWWDS